MRQIAANAGVDGSIVVDKVKNGKGAFGFNAATEEYEDLVKAGVIDPTKVVRAALQNAASVASLMLTTEALIAERPEEEVVRRRRWPRRWRRHGRHGRHGRRGRRLLDRSHTPIDPKGARETGPLFYWAPPSPRLTQRPENG